MHEQDSGPDASTQPGNPARRRIFQAAAAAGVVAGVVVLAGLRVARVMDRLTVRHTSSTASLPIDGVLP